MMSRTSFALVGRGLSSGSYEKKLGFSLCTWAWKLASNSGELESENTLPRKEEKALATGSASMVGTPSMVKSTLE